MRVIPEGVETAGQLERLAALGCDYVQGFHLCRPLDAAQLEALLRRRGSTNTLLRYERVGPAVRRPA
jgi:EAL domain-containing protein (putative c-di-GMP-specific phosphodiesterase class I)